MSKIEQFACVNNTIPAYVVNDGKGNLSLMQNTWNRDPLDNSIPDK